MRLIATLGGAALVALLAAEGLVAQRNDGVARPKGQTERIICKDIQETGSLARQRRQCFTRAEWDRIAEAARARGQRLTSDMASGMVSN